MSTKKKIIGVEDLQKRYGRLTFGRLLESHRLSDEANQKDFAKKLKMTASSLCDLENGRRIPSASRASKIAKILGVSEKVFIEIALQDQLNSEGLENIKVSVA